jgi:hypothetical protein
MPHPKRSATKPSPKPAPAVTMMAVSEGTGTILIEKTYKMNAKKTI